MISIDKADAIKKRFMWDNQSVCLFSYGRKHGEDSNKIHLQAFHRQRMPYPVTKP